MLFVIWYELVSAIMKYVTIKSVSWLMLTRVHSTIATQRNVIRVRLQKII